MSGDALSVRLFIAATAIAFLCAGITQAGWKHKLFLRFLFGLAAVLGAASIFWERITNLAPRVAQAISTVAGSATSWFGLLLIGFTVMLFLDWSERVRSRADSKVADEVSFVS